MTIAQRTHPIADTVQVLLLDPEQREITLIALSQLHNSAAERARVRQEPDERARLLIWEDRVRRVLEHVERLEAGNG